MNRIGVILLRHVDLQALLEAVIYIYSSTNAKTPSSV